jgi:hypothetical protein
MWVPTQVCEVGGPAGPVLQPLLYEVVDREHDEEELCAHEQVVGRVVVLEQVHHLDVHFGQDSAYPVWI